MICLLAEHKGCGGNRKKRILETMIMTALRPTSRDQNLDEARQQPASEHL